MPLSLATPARAAPCLPDYGGGSIVNLIASIACAFGARDWPVARLSEPSLAGSLDGAKRIALLVVDGMGQAQLARAPWRGALAHHVRGTLTSVFPSTTATAITTLMTGLPPSQHGLTGWHMYFPEIAAVGAVLPFRTRASDRPIAALGLPPAQVFNQRPLFDRLPVASFALAPERIVSSEFNRAHTGSAERIGYRSLEHLFQALVNCLDRQSGPCFVYAYFPDFDAMAHEHGADSAPALRALQRFDEALGDFLPAAARLNTVVAVTADHGFIDSPPQRSVLLEDHPALQAMLLLPLCGERRAAYCYVRPGMVNEFEAYVTDRLSDQVWLFASAALIEQGWFGPGTPHPKLNERVGDYTLVARDDWTVKDWLPGEKRHTQLGVHGGVSADEMIVPLVVAWP
ncbi:MAG TPA: alkaline phosphatase family protein [Burkholderiales bacterium]|nr:alkaline phosphatase family protein [Burkholderiales bacterium]